MKEKKADTLQSKKISLQKSVFCSVVPPYVFQYGCTHFSPSICIPLNYFYLVCKGIKKNESTIYFLLILAEKKRKKARIRPSESNHTPLAVVIIVPISPSEGFSELVLHFLSRHFIAGHGQIIVIVFFQRLIFIHTNRSRTYPFV